ncbi:MAG: metal-dependent transcriptional regulator [Desulfurococcales archaeon]|nr:metal-dependent transcriptional regulator [Desulfurococcales archaeon]
MEKASYDQLYNMIKKGHDRKGRRSSAIEEYLETIHELEKVMGWVRIKDLSKILNVKPSSVTKTIKKLHSEGLVIYERYRGVRLSKAGIEAVHKLGRKHEILAELLKEAGLEETEAQAEAERLEHIIPDRLIEHLEKFLKKYREAIARCREGYIARKRVESL